MGVLLEDIDAQAAFDVYKIIEDERVSSEELSVERLIEMWQDLVLSHASRESESMAEMETFIECYFDDLGSDMRSILMSIALHAEIVLLDEEFDILFNTPQVNLISGKRTWVSGELVYITQHQERWKL